MAQQLADPTDYGNPPGDGPLRAGGVSLSGVPQKDSSLPSTLSHAAKRQRGALQVCRDSWYGTEVVRDEKSTEYLPKNPGESPTNYLARLSRSVFFNAFRRTVEGLAGLVFRVDPALGDDVPAQIKEQWENLDLAGTHGDVFLRDLLADALTAGHAGILVEYPEVSTERQGDGTQAVLESTGQLRPYWIHIKKEQMLSWRTTVVDGRTILTQMVIEECTYVPDGEFGEKKQERYRVLYLSNIGPAWRLLEITPDKRVATVGEGLFANQDEIPLAEVPTSGRRDLFDSDPPLLDLAYLNLAHYQQQSDYFTSIHKTCVPILFGAGITSNEPDGNETSVVVGPNSMIKTGNENATLAYVSHSGEALGSCRQSLEDLQNQMGTLGLAMLAPQKRSAETAEAKRLDKATSDSSLAVAARGLQDGVERAMGFHARYLPRTAGATSDGGSLEVNRDFEGISMEPAVMTAFAALIAQGLPIDVVLAQLQVGGRIAEDVNLDELAQRMMAEQAAKEAERAEQMAANFGGPQAA